LRTKSFINNNVYATVFNVIYYFFMMNIYFGITNILFLIVVGTVPFDSEYIFIYAFSLIPTGPSFAALLSCLNKYHKEKELNITRDFFTSYRYFLKKTITVWLMSLIILTNIIYGYLFLLKTQYVVVFTPVIFLSFYIVLTTTINYFTFLVKNADSAINELLIISFFFTFKKFYIGILNIFIILSLFFTIILTTLSTIFFLSSILMYLLYLNNNYLYKNRRI